MNALVLGFLLASAQDFQVPPVEGWVSDRADLLSPSEEQALEALMDSYRVGTGHDIALLTLPSLEGRPIGEVAKSVAREWGLGGKDLNDGALLVVARDERELRIEVGRGLEGGLTDSVSGRIIRDVITPELREGRMYAGIDAGIKAIHAAIGGDYGPLERSPGGKAASGSGIGCVLALVLFFLFLRLSSGRGGGLGGKGGIGGMLPWLILSSMGHGRSSGGGFRGGGFGGGGGGFRGFGGGGGFSGGGASGRW